MRFVHNYSAICNQTDLEKNIYIYINKYVYAFSLKTPVVYMSCNFSLLIKYCDNTELHKENASVKKNLGQNLLKIFYFIDPVFPVNQRIFRKICHLHCTQHWLWTMRLDDTHNHDVFTRTQAGFSFRHAVDAVDEKVPGLVQNEHGVVIGLHLQHCPLHPDHRHL